MLPPRLGGFGGKGIRTPDIQLAKLALYQLSYAPVLEMRIVDGGWRIAIWGEHATRVLISATRRNSFRKSANARSRWPARESHALPKTKMPDGFWAIRHFDCRSAAKTELCVTVSEFFKPWFLSIPRA